MQFWYTLLAVGRKIWIALKKAFTFIKRKIDAAIPSKELRIILLVALAILSAFLAYVIALFHVGIWNGVATISGLINLYLTTDSQFPFFFYFIAIILAAIVTIWFFRKDTDDDRNFKYSDSDVYGSAGEISEEDLKKVGEVKPIEALAGTILGQLDTTGEKVIGMTPKPTANRNMIAFASPGQGKSFTIVKPQIVQAIRRGESVVCTDTKGELRAETIELARRYGYTINNINLKYLKYSDGWDVLKELRCDDERAMIFAQIVMRNTGNPKDPHMALEEALLKACCLYVERNPLIPPNEKTFYKVYSMILQGPAKLDEIFASAQFSSNLRVAYDAYAIFTGSDNLRTNVIGNLASRIQVLSSPVVQDLTALDEVDLTLPGRKKCIYYVTMSDQHETMKFLASLFFTFLFLDLGDYADAQIDRRLPVPVNVILEEAANVGEIVGLTNYLSSARSRAIAITLIFQGLTQIRKTYGEEDTGTILNDCFVHACLGTMERGTAEHFEWLSGIATVKVKTEQHDAYESPLTANYRHSTGDGRRNVFTSNEVRKIQQGYIMLGWLGYDTIKCHTFGIVEHPEYKKGYMPVIPPMPAVPLANKEARAYLRAMEEQRVAEYEEWENDGGYAWEGYDFPPPKCDGPSRFKPKPKVIPYPELEQMALAHAEQAADQAVVFPPVQFRKAQGTVSPVPGETVTTPPAEPIEICTAACTEEVTSSTVSPEVPAENPAPADISSAPQNPQAAPVIADKGEDKLQANTIPVEAPEVPASIVETPAVQRSKNTVPTPTRPKRSGSGTLYAGKTIKRNN